MEATTVFKDHVRTYERSTEEISQRRIQKQRGKAGESEKSERGKRFNAFFIRFRSGSTDIARHLMLTAGS